MKFNVTTFISVKKYIDLTYNPTFVNKKNSTPENFWLEFRRIELHQIGHRSFTIFLKTKRIEKCTLHQSSLTATREDFWNILYFKISDFFFLIESHYYHFISVGHTLRSLDTQINFFIDFQDNFFFEAQIQINPKFSLLGILGKKTRNPWSLDSVS